MEPVRDKKYTYADYLTWDDGNQYELIDGVVYMLASPSVSHQDISRELVRQFADHLEGKKCRVYYELDVRLDPYNTDDALVRPDIFVVCDPKKIANGKNCEGVPDMVIEILSPSTAQRDQVIKFNQYLNAGVREYWIVYPEARTVQVYLLDNRKYVGQNYKDTDTIHVHVLEDCRVNLTKIFPPLPAEVKSSKGDH